MDVVDLRDFYQSALGQIAAREITDSLRPFVKVAPEQTVMGLGYATPYLDRLIPENIRQLAFMQAKQGVTHWPNPGPDGELVSSALVDEFDLPLLESAVDLALVVHGLELSDNPLEMLQECWRVLAPQGKLVLVVPNRRGLWAMAESNPFGHGQPFSKSQLSRLLKEARFALTNWSPALYLPPIEAQWMHGTATAFERTGRALAKGVSGVLVVEAQKQVYAFSSGKRARRFVPRLRPALLTRPTNRDKSD
jgi:SAM-dependent methyltransferase